MESMGVAKREDSRDVSVMFSCCVFIDGEQSMLGEACEGVLRIEVW